MIKNRLASLTDLKRGIKSKIATAKFKISGTFDDLNTETKVDMITQTSTK
jgi:hypothetical protein